MRRNKFLALIAIFATLFAGCGTLFAQDATNFKQIKMTKGHHKNVTSVSCSPDGKYVLSGSTDSTLIIWNPKSGARLNPLKGHNSFVECVSWSPDGRYFASGSLNGGVIIWDANSNARVRTLKGHTFGIESICWSPDGKYLASGAADKTIVIWDANSGAKLKILEGHEKTVTSVSWSPDGKYLASGAKDDLIIIWDVNSGQKLKTLQGHTKNVNSVCWSPDGKYLASGSKDKTVIVWDATGGAILQTMKGHSFGVNCVSWSPDGKYLASASWDMSIVLWNPNNGKNLQTLKGHTFSVESLCWTADSKYLISGAGDQTVRIWSEETEYIYREVPLPDRKPARDIVTTENKPENGVETEQTQIEKPAKMIIKKSIEKTGDEILIKEYDQQGNLIKITKSYAFDKSPVEFTLRDGKILSVKGGNSDIASPSVNKQENTANYWLGGVETRGKFNEFGFKEEEVIHDGGEWSFSYEYNKDGLLVKEEFIDHDAWESTLTKTTTTYTYDVMSQDWTKRTGTDNKGNKTVTTRTVEKTEQIQENKSEDKVIASVEAEQVPTKKVIKKSIEKTDGQILIKEYDQQGKLIKITENDPDNGNSLEFTLRDGKILSAKASGSSYSDASVDKQNNTATYYNWSEIRIGFNKFGYSKIENLEWGSEDIYEYNEAGLLVRVIGSYEGFGSDEFVDCKRETTFSYDVNNQDWTKRTGKQVASCISDKTKKTKVMDTSTSTTTRTVEYW